MDDDTRSALFNPFIRQVTERACAAINGTVEEAAVISEIVQMPKEVMALIPVPNIVCSLMIAFRTAGILDGGISPAKMDKALDETFEAFLNACRQRYDDPHFKDACAASLKLNEEHRAAEDATQLGETVRELDDEAAAKFDPANDFRNLLNPKSSN